MTWHQWHHTASRSRRTRRFSCLACAKTALDHGCHASFVDLGVDSWARAAGRIRKTDKRMESRVFMASDGNTEAETAWMAGSRTADDPLPPIFVSVASTGFNTGEEVALRRRSG